VKLIDGDGLAELIEEYYSLDLVAEYLDFIEPAEPVDQSDSNVSESSGGESPSEAGAASLDEASTDSQPLISETAPSTRWRNVILGTSVGWLVVLFGVTALPEGLWGVLFIRTWLGLPMAIYLDTRRLAEYVEWPKYRWLYIVSSLVWFVAVIPGGIYLWRRRSVIGASS